MKRSEISYNRKSWLAAVMGIIMIGMGQIYNGEFLKGVSFSVIFAVTFITGFRLSVLLPGGYPIVGLALTLLVMFSIYIFTIIEAYKKASEPLDDCVASDDRASLDDYKLRYYNKWYFYVAIWMLLAVQVNWAVSNYVRKNFIQLFKIPTMSMQPKVLRGDMVIAEMTAYERMAPRREDVVVFIHPDYRNKLYLAEIETLPGETRTMKDGRTATIPHGYVFVKKIRSGEVGPQGGPQGEPQDSRVFGPVPLRDVIGKIRQVIFSSGEQGIRWERIGEVIS